MPSGYPPCFPPVGHTSQLCVIQPSLNRHRNCHRDKIRTPLHSAARKGTVESWNMVLVAIFVEIPHCATTICFCVWRAERAVCGCEQTEKSRIECMWKQKQQSVEEWPYSSCVRVLWDFCRDFSCRCGIFWWFFAIWRVEGKCFPVKSVGKIFPVFWECDCGTGAGVLGSNFVISRGTHFVWILCVLLLFAGESLSA